MSYMMRNSETHGRVKIVYLVCIRGTVGRWDTAINYITIYFLHKAFVAAVGEYHKWLPNFGHPSHNTSAVKYSSFSKKISCMTFISAADGCCCMGQRAEEKFCLLLLLVLLFFLSSDVVGYFWP
jgi:hypothetical protein